MFHFGLFSSFIPYLIIAAIYFCGLASYSVDIVNSQISDNKNKSEYNSEYEFSLNSDNYFIKIDNSTQNIVICNKEHFYTTYISTVFWQFFKPDSKKNYYSFFIFSRPPPYLS